MLKGVSLKDKKNELNARFNPEGFRFQIIRPAGTRHLAHAASLPGAGSAGTMSGTLYPGSWSAARAGAGYRGGPRVLMFATDHLVLDRRILQQARSLTRAGYDVTVVSGFECPNEEHYMEHGVAVHRYKYPGDGEAYRRAPGTWLRQLLRRVPDRWAGLLKRLARCALRPFARRCYGSPSFESFIRRKVSQFPADVVHVHDLPLLWLGVELAGKWDAKLVYDAHEIYYVHHSIPAKVRDSQMRQERKFVPRTDLFTTVNEKIADYFQQQYGVRPLALMELRRDAAGGF